MNLMIFGAGFSGLAIARALGNECDFAGGTTRGPGRFGELRAAGLEPFIYEGGDPSPDLTRGPVAHHPSGDVDRTPIRAAIPLLDAFADGLGAVMPKLEWIGYLSTVGVYGDHGGEWVNEDTVCRPVSERSVARLAAEQGWADLAEKAGVPLAVIRLSGIYGPGPQCDPHPAAGQGAPADQARPGVQPHPCRRTSAAPPRCSPAIVLAASTMSPTTCPRRPRMWSRWRPGSPASRRRRKPISKTADLSPMARSFYGENKRVSNARIKAAGYEFLYPDYESGLEGLLRDGI